ncbi:MAG: hypothetical protein EA407_12610 [Rhodobacteraceae bacterium]|nr:MAG: hypothetical protein EA407_12610 [Paracoccaceae bacterium]
MMLGAPVTATVLAGQAVNDPLPHARGLRARGHRLTAGVDPVAVGHQQAGLARATDEAQAHAAATLPLARGG